jgi:hypothetical protein
MLPQDDFSLVYALVKKLDRANKLEEKLKNGGREMTDDEVIKYRLREKTTVYKVIDTLPIGANTSVLIEGSGESFRNEMTVFDENGKHYKVLTVAMTGGRVTEEAKEKTSLLIEGRFSSKEIHYIWNNEFMDYLAKCYEEGKEWHNEQLVKKLIARGETDKTISYITEKSVKEIAEVREKHGNALSEDRKAKNIKEITELLPALSEDDISLVYALVKKLIKAWDPDFTKLTPNEKEALKKAETELKNGEI